MPPTRTPPLSPQYLDLAGVRYVVLPEREFQRLCTAAGIAPPPSPESASADSAPGTDRGQLGPLGIDSATLARRLRQRRRRAGFTQVELARRAGIRVETLNRIERGHNTPDFATIRKLVEAMRLNATAG